LKRKGAQEGPLFFNYHQQTLKMVTRRRASTLPINGIVYHFFQECSDLPNACGLWCDRKLGVLTCSNAQEMHPLEYELCAMLVINHSLLKQKK